MEFSTGELAILAYSVKMYAESASNDQNRLTARDLEDRLWAEFEKMYE